jgi:carboxypeptidase C (cathepsin A)
VWQQACIEWKHCRGVLCRVVQVAGYAVEFKNGLTFATVKGAGHMIPQTHPQAALALLQQWMARQL